MSTTRDLTEIEKLFKKHNITGGTAFHRINHLVDSRYIDGTLAELRQMLKNNDSRLIQLDSEGRHILEGLVK